MGIFSSSTKQEAKLVINLNTFATEGHAILVTNMPVKDKMQTRRHTITCSPRDCNESSKEYDKEIKKQYILPVHEGFLLTNNGWSEHKTILLVLPNKIEDIPYGLDPDFKEMIIFGILKKNTEITVREMLESGIRERDDLLKEAYSLSFAKDYKSNIELWVDAILHKEGVSKPKKEEST